MNARLRRPRRGRPYRHRRCAGRERALRGMVAGMLVAGAASVASCSSPAPSPKPSDALTAASQPACPNPEGDLCVGLLEPEHLYTTQVFTPMLSYEVPDDGWVNAEDNPGNFLLIPPDNTLPGVDAGTSDFIGVYTDVTPAEFLHPPDCATAQVSGTIDTPAEMAAWLQKDPALTVTRPTPATVGGLHGLVTDIAVRPGAVLPTCRDGSVSVTVDVLFKGLPPSTLDHGVVAGMTMRLHMLAFNGGILAVEVDDVHAAPGDLPYLSEVVGHLAFAT